MGIPGSANLLLAAGEAAAYQLEQSLRFNDDDSAHLSKTSTEGTRTAWTWSCWVKATRFDGTAQAIFGSAPAGTLYNDIGFDNGQFRFRQYHSSGGGNSWELKTDARYRDPSAWYHIVLRFDSAQSTSSDRVKIWINGAQVTDFATETYPGQNISSLINSGYEHGIGKLEPTFNYYFDGYLAEMHFVDNDVTLTPTDFGEYDDNGVWRPIEVTGLTYGTRGFYLTFSPDATNGIGHDHSGNGLNWTPSNLTTSGTGTDVMSDTPTTNWATLNPLWPANQSVVESEGNLEAQFPNSACKTQATMGMTSGKYYWEVDFPTFTAGGAVGIANDGTTVTDLVGKDANSWAYFNNAKKRTNNVAVSWGNTWTGTDIIGVAFDADNGDLYFYKNGAAQESGAAAYTGLTNGPYYPAFSDDSGSTSSTVRANFGQREFAYPPGTSSATGYFNTLTYTGNGSTQSVTGCGFQPDLVWIKCRSVGTDHVLTDVVRGATKTLRSNVTGAEYTQSDALTSFDSDGFSLGDDNDGGPAGNFNINARTYVAWCWKAGGTASANNAGSLNATVSASNDAGFSVVTYTGNSTSGATFAHGLSAAPTFVVVKNRDSSSQGWMIYHASLGNTKAIQFTSSSFLTDTSYWNDTTPSSTLVTLGNDNATNASGDDFVAYCWTDKTGVTKTGTYAGNGSDPGNISVDCGFKPAMVMVKGDASASWQIIDNERGEDTALFPDANSAENSRSDRKILLTQSGFIVQGNDGNINSSGVDYYFIAFAENFSADTDYKALNTKNLPAPDIADGSDYFNTVLYTGNGSTQSITGVGFQPSWVWTKKRSGSQDHFLYDVVRGSTDGNFNELRSSSTATEGVPSTASTGLTSLDSDGFSIGSDNSVNTNNDTYVAWNWLAGGSGSSNTAGSITSTVSVNASAGFSIVSYQSQTATKPITLGHGLGVKPSMIICKNRDGASSWTVYHSELGATKGIFLNSSIASVTSADYWNNTEPTSTVFTVNDSTGTHAYGTSNDMIAYCFAEVEGYSKFGSYEGNNNDDNAFIWLGFTPSFVMIKNADASSNWIIHDTTRDTYNPSSTDLYPNTSGAEPGYEDNYMDFLSNGIKIRDTSGPSGNSNTYIYAAFSSHPFGGDGVSPATAR